MIRESDIRDVEIIDMYPRAVQDEVYLALGGMARVGWQIPEVGAFKIGCGKKEFELASTEKGVEVARNNHFFFGSFDKGM